MGSAWEFEYLNKDMERRRVENNYCNICFYKNEYKNINTLKEKFKKALLKTLSDINNYNTEDLISLHYDMNLSSEQFCEIDNYICRIIDHAAKLASGIVDDIDEY